jgi:uncharacterized protein (TIGR01777 family)
MKIVIAGGSGQVGTILAREFHKSGHEVVVLSRKIYTAPWRIVYWDGQSLADWCKELEGAEVLINLTGKSVNCRYVAKNRCEIWSSRARSVRVLAQAISELKVAPKVWLQASTATIYRHSLDRANDEFTGELGGLEQNAPDTWKFSIDVARAWEGEFALVNSPQTRKVILRSAMTMSPDRNGIFDYLLWLVRIGLGGTAASGQQYISWIHDRDFINAILFLIEHQEISGVVNLAAPQPLTNRDFMRTLRQAWGQRLGLPSYKWMLEIGAILLGTESELVLKSRRVVPTRLLQAGFKFEYSEWSSAVQDLFSRWKDQD